MGGSVWGASWLGSYLAVGGYKDTNSHYVVGERIQEANTIQIWHVPLASAGSSTSASSTSAAGKSKRRQKMSRDHDDDDVDDADDNTNGTNKKNGSAPASPRLALLLEHQWGPCFNLEWWPGSASSVHDNTSPLLGILGGCFGDGAFRLLAVPRPTPDIDEPVVLQVQSVLMKAYRPDTTYFCFTFGGDRRVALGCANGFITIYDIPWALANPVDPEPMAHFPAHDAFVRDVSFESGAEVPNVLSTSGADGRLNVWDLRDLFVPIPLFRARAFLMSCEWSKCADSVYFADSDHALRVYRMPDIRGSAVLLMHRSTIWSQCTSAHHPFLVTASADGLVKAVNAHRVRHRVVKPASLLALSVSVIDPQGTFQYRDNLGYEEFDGSLLKKEAGYVLKSDQRVALQTASWNPERRHAGWIAVGGANGIVSILNLEQ
ncbi:WD40-repeat-containing domain protein [Blastocladiella britannica]|nr:WD40-repeat-containing domain protein [Blastocladiella britannica]